MGSSIQENYVKSIEAQQESYNSSYRTINAEDCVKVQHESSASDVKLDQREAILDDWQGIETTELEKKFGVVVAFLGSKTSSDRVNSIDNEEKM
ncbi:hypothetical protein L2E82_07889 [Cichorium intybus]|uniref:Uncharacterized protein n=1 Tax=Cichorium intybus TaxID=13427 RepID=A0ACB9G666_CICIN|nr:hypothetical protein L2E82_07889 [Cichorium intybus]